LTAEYLKKAKANKGGDKPNSSLPCPEREPLQLEENNEKVFIVYKFIQTPIDAIIAGM
jgi:hypothetical protein